MRKRLKKWISFSTCWAGSAAVRRRPGSEQYRSRIGRDLINPEAVQRRELDWIRELAGRFLKTVKHAQRKDGVSMPSASPV